jgi:hypothetical protein
MIDHETTERETARWRILRVLDASWPLPYDEQKILHALSGARVELSSSALRRELAFLAACELVELTDRKTPLWSACLTNNGVNVLQYAVECPPGIARPAKW